MELIENTKAIKKYYRGRGIHPLVNTVGYVVVYTIFTFLWYQTGDTFYLKAGLVFDGVWWLQSLIQNARLGKTLRTMGERAMLDELVGKRKQVKNGELL
jgi:hypothetical protein